MLFEHHTQPVISQRRWLVRMVRASWLSILVVSVALLIGLLGYHFIGRLPWIDALLEASMILGGMGAIAPLHGNAIKLFASFYALFSGLVVLSTMGIMLAPALHRILHTHLSKK